MSVRLIDENGKSLVGPGGGLKTEINPTELVLLPAAARTATVVTPDQTNNNGRGCHLIVDVTAASGTSPTLTVSIEGKDPASGKYYTILSSAAIAAIGTYVLRVYPGETVAANAAASDVLPRTWRVNAVIGGTTPSFTFSVGAVIVS